MCSTSYINLRSLVGYFYQVRTQRETMVCIGLDVRDVNSNLVRVSAADAALQMQRELQWFKEVEKILLLESKK
ncbi:hypothetical protein LOK49_LG01G00357 [Camellia lanceoleosa]|uniref:Uncharacterized protein n=1 Tax=Camellia lanceoleosa TaxID=1840588 RepID=A0ACC0J5H9_9ERIC|nr:hypothetical protein LOK49_LG01G00357 [Camellia lanceoleosa]